MGNIDLLTSIALISTSEARPNTGAANSEALVIGWKMLDLSSMYVNTLSFRQSSRYICKLRRFGHGEKVLTTVYYTKTLLSKFF